MSNVKSPPLKDLGVLKLKKSTKLFIVDMPTNCQSMVVSYGEDIKVSCVVPPQKRDIQVLGIEDDFEWNPDTGKYCSERKEYVYTIDCPSLLLTAVFDDYPKYGNSAIHTYYLLQLNTKVTDRIEAAPYLMPNVYEEGKICWGKMRTPNSLREAFNTFWNSPFNEELLQESSYSNIFEYLDNFHHMEAAQPWSDYTSFVCGDDFWAAPVGSEALLVSGNQELLKQIPKQYLKQGPYNKFVVLQANRINDKWWEFKSGGYRFLLSADNVVETCSKSAKITKLKKKFG